MTIADLPTKTKELFKIQAIRSLIVLPLIDDYDLIGFICFDNCKLDKLWHSKNHEFLIYAAQSLTSTIRSIYKEQKIEDQQNQIKCFFSETSDLLILKDLNFIYLMVNPAFCKFFDKIENELIGKTDFDIFSKELAEMYRENDIEVISTLGKQNYERGYDLPDGSAKWFHVSKTPIFNSNGNLTAILTSIRDLTKQKQIENELKLHKDNLDILVKVRTKELKIKNEALNKEIIDRELVVHALQESRKRYQILFKNSPTPMWEVDNTELIEHFTGLKKNGIINFEKYLDNKKNLNECINKIRLTNVNEATIKLHGAKSQKELVENFLNLFTEKSVKVIQELFVEIANGKTKCFKETNSKTFNNKIIDLNLYLNITKQELNNKTKYMGLVSTIDISENKAAILEILKLSKAIEQSSTTVIITNLDGNIEYVNKNFEVTTGYTKEEVLGQSPRMLKSKENSSIDYANLWETIKSGKTWIGEFKNIKKNGDIFIEEATISPIKDDKGNIINFIAIKTDITEKKLLQKKLEYYNFELEKRVEERTKELTLSEGNYRTLAESMDEYICRLDNDLNITYVNSSLLQALGKEITEVLGRKLYSFLNLFETGKNIKIAENIIRQRKPGKIIRKVPWGKWIEWRIIVENNNIYGSKDLIIVGHDVTKRKQIELKIKKALINEKELNHLKSQFVSTVSHEFRAPLTNISLSSELIENYYDKLSKKEKEEHFTSIHSSINVLAKMLDDVISLNKTESTKINLKITQFDFVQFARQILEVAISQFSKTPTVQLNSNLKNKIIHSDQEKMRNILLNLFSNAIKFSKNNKEIKINILISNYYIDVDVIDQGIGISYTDQNKIFDPFFRSKNSALFSGSGLGLSIAKKSVEMLNGNISVSGKMGEGSKFSVRLPIKQNEDIFLKNYNEE